MPNVDFHSRFNWRYLTNDANCCVVLIVCLLNLLMFAIPSAAVWWNWANIPEDEDWTLSWLLAGYICTGFGFGCCCLCCCQFCTRVKSSTRFPFVALKKRGPLVQDETAKKKESEVAFAKINHIWADIYFTRARHVWSIPLYPSTFLIKIFQQRQESSSLELLHTARLYGALSLCSVH